MEIVTKIQIHHFVPVGMESERELRNANSSIKEEQDEEDDLMGILDTWIREYVK